MPCPPTVLGVQASDQAAGREPEERASRGKDQQAQHTDVGPAAGTRRLARCGGAGIAACPPAADKQASLGGRGRRAGHQGARRREGRGGEQGDHTGSRAHSHLLPSRSSRRLTDTPSARPGPVR